MLINIKTIKIKVFRNLGLTFMRDFSVTDNKVSRSVGQKVE
jgi:hypothetical protein